MKKTELMKRFAGALLAGGMIAGMCAGCGSSGSSGSSADGSAASGKAGDVYRIGYTNQADSDVWLKLVEDEFVAQMDADSSVEVTCVDANLDQQKQLDQIDNFIMQDMDLIIAVACDYSGVTPGVEAANEAGIPVVTLAIQSEGGEATFVGCQHREAGVMQAEQLAEELPENAKVLYLSGTPGLYHSAQREEGFTTVINEKRPDVEILASMTGEYVRDKAMKVVEDWCQTYTQFDAIVCANDEMALGAIEALKAADRLDGVMVCGVDATKEACAKIENGEMLFSICQPADTIAKTCVDTISKLRAGEEVDDIVAVNFELVTAENVQDYK